VAESDHLLAFHHPVPGFQPVHVLLVPKFSAPSLVQLTRARREQLAGEVELLAPQVVDEAGTSDAGFLVLVNGGSRQDVAQVHFHVLIEGYELARAPSTVPVGTWTDVAQAPAAVHRVRFGEHALLAGLECAAASHSAELATLGYSVVWDARNREADGIVHLIAGKRRSRE
jgi:histidine triad (HIT) family protein